MTTRPREATPNAAFAFAAREAIEAGEWDRFLVSLAVAVRKRMELIDRSKKPSEPPPPYQHWVWMNGPGTPHWEIVGTGAILP